VERDYRGDISKRGTSELFFQAVKHVRGDALPVFCLEGITFLFIRSGGLYLVLTTIKNVSPLFAFEFLGRMHKLFKDYAGIVTEESIRKNFVLLYEILDEVMDFGIPQQTATESLKAFVHSPPVLTVDSTPAGAIERLIQTQLKTAPSAAANRTVQSERSDKDEIFVDLLEKLTVLFGAGGSLLSARIDGSIVMRSFLKGSPELRLALNEDLVVGKSGSRYGRVCIDDITFHECCKVHTFEMDRSVNFHPPDGEFLLLNYRVTDDFRVPFRVTPFIEEIDSRKVDIIVKIRMDVPEGISASNVVAKLPLPKSVISASVQMTAGPAGQNWEFLESEKAVAFGCRKLLSDQEITARIKLNLSVQIPTIRKEIGPLSLFFELPMYTCSNVAIRYLKTNNDAPIPYRWVRLISSATSYVVRL